MSYDSYLEAELERAKAQIVELERRIGLQDMVLKQGEKEIDQKAKLLEKFKARDARRRDDLRALRRELFEARDNIGELNSMIVEKESVLASVRRANRNQAEEIANQAQRIRDLNSQVANMEAEGPSFSLRDAQRDLAVAQKRVEAQRLQVASLEAVIKDLRVQLRVRDQTTSAREAHLETQLTQAREQVKSLQDQVTYLEGELEDEVDDAPNLALATCKKKLEQLEGMLEAQRRNTRELGVNLQRVRDERTALKTELAEVRGREDGRLANVVRERDDYLKQLGDLQAKVNRVRSTLAPVKVTETPGPYTGEPAWMEQMRSPKAAPFQAPREARPCGASVPATHGYHRCAFQYDHRNDPSTHVCSCGEQWI